MFERWQATVLPTTYLLDAAGVPRYVGRGPLEWDGVEASELVERVLGEIAASDKQPAPGMGMGTGMGMGGS